MELEVRPEPSDQERAAIVAALAPEAETPTEAWPRSALPQQDELEEP
jgi:hypothetical protein